MSLLPTHEMSLGNLRDSILGRTNDTAKPSPLGVGCSASTQLGGRRDDALGDMVQEREGRITRSYREHSLRT